MQLLSTDLNGPETQNRKPKKINQQVKRLTTIPRREDKNANNMKPQLFPVPCFQLLASCIPTPCCRFAETYLDSLNFNVPEEFDAGLGPV